MGGCATKPKVLKGDEMPSPVAPSPEPAKKHVQVADDEGKKVEAEIVKAKDVDETKEVVIVNDAKLDDQANDPQSGSNLLNENEKKGVAETESDSNTPSEPTKTESVEAVKQESMETEPPSIGGKAATVAVGETQNRETAAAAEGEEGKTEVTK
ncbi:Helicase required for RNAi-mediated heterochromatin assembly 1 [Gossypium arboreum]|uniref:Helicase required for RNAi-mediated heterochromatin assembly 1 n=2 Tax=Gossypium arboreum TaxID=29729 RepID=A0A0B0PIT7_GOSAR|nr:uncharacterized protein LOC108452395 [Gossypium arboreum]KAK5775750.1 hypothetical protein PVK06_043689 [Gossypium arboreum]KHG24344.1 Helicase required for RNAi-mediated heterochromatin assembly 1 [Gossypium arboreum]